MKDCPNPHSHRITKNKWNVHKSNILGVILLGDGTCKYVLKCPQCKRHLGHPTKKIAREMMRRGYRPVIIRTYEPISYPPCAYRDCPNPGIDRHHWAPRNVFGYADCDNWPVSYLCKDHHRHWHAEMDGYRRNATRPEHIKAKDESSEWMYGSLRLAENPWRLAEVNE